MDMTEQGITRMEIYRNVLDDDNEVAFNQNRLVVSNLASTMPFDMNS